MYMKYFGFVPKKSAKIANTKNGKNACYAKLVDRVLEMFPGFWSNM